MSLRVIVALGGNALLRRGERLDAATQQRNVTRAAAAIAALAAEHAVVVTHGNGPQVGLLALQAAAVAEVEPYPLDVLGAESEGMIGYLLEQALASRLPGVRVATLLTQVEVDPDDPAFGAPTKPIGPLYAEADARRLADARGWAVAPDGDGFRRVVASPRPLRILEIETIRLLADAGVLVVCGGGGGVPVTVDAAGAVRGVEAVVDKDRSAALLAGALDADALLILTDVDAVYDGWGTTEARPLRRVTPAELRGRRFDAGSMGPKVEAACDFVVSGGAARFAAIGALDDAVGLLDGSAGTRVAG